MILYNVTIILHDEIHLDWLSWMQNHHIPDVMATNCFASYRMLKVLDSPNEGVTYCVQYLANDLKNYQEYKEKYAAHLQADYPSNFENKLVIFGTLMEFIDPK